MKKLIAAMLCAVMTFGLCACSSGSSGSSGSGSKEGYKIGFTDNYNGNSYHQSMEKYMTETADKLKDEGHISETQLLKLIRMLQHRFHKFRIL